MEKVEIGLPNYRVNLPVQTVAGRACEHPAPVRPAGYAEREADFALWQGPMV